MGRFSDPVAVQLLREDELGPVRAARAESAAAAGAGALRVESVRARAQVVVPRTVVIDEAVTAAVRASTAPQVVVVGTGPDTRPWRLAALSVDLLEVARGPGSPTGHLRSLSNGRVAVARYGG